jgi:hypothetical protein
MTSIQLLLITAMFLFLSINNKKRKSGAEQYSQNDFLREKSVILQFMTTNAAQYYVNYRMQTDTNVNTFQQAIVSRKTTKKKTAENKTTNGGKIFETQTADSQNIKLDRIVFLKNAIIFSEFINRKH